MKRRTNSAGIAEKGGTVMKNMKKWMHLVLVLLLSAAVAGPARSEDKPKEKKQKEVYSATAFAATTGAKSLSLTIYIDDYTTDAEIHALAQTLKTGGSDAVLKAMEKVKPEKGRVAVVGRTGNDVAIIRSRPAEKGKRRIILVTARPIGFLELRQGTRSRDYQFGVMELLLDEKGKGSGTALPAAKIWFNKKGELEIEHLGMEPVRLVNVFKF